jgi:hypothetical protein
MYCEYRIALVIWGLFSLVAKGLICIGLSQHRGITGRLGGIYYSIQKKLK